MAVLINFKICDNAEECNGVTICPTGALTWDKKKKSIKIDNKKCISCGKCEKSCMVDAIRVAKNEKEYKKIKKEIDGDPRKSADLFVDRYGADSVHPAFLISEEKFVREVFNATKLTMAEIFDDNSIMCLLRSIPIREIVGEKDIKYRKVKVGDRKFLKKYKISKLPALVFYKEGKLFGKIEGYYEEKQKEKLFEKVKKIITKR